VETMSFEAVINIDKLKVVVPKTEDIKSIYIFGSYAYGEPNKDSDIDFAVITGRPFEQTTDVYMEMSEVFEEVTALPFDLLVYNQDRFNSRVNEGYYLEKTIYEKGIKLYETN
jgi:predicted nucleotidyltransferase